MVAYSVLFVTDDLKRRKRKRDLLKRRCGAAADVLNKTDIGEDMKEYKHRS